jgi:hypothetical protein
MSKVILGRHYSTRDIWPLSESTLAILFQKSRFLFAFTLYLLFISPFGIHAQETPASPALKQNSSSNVVKASHKEHRFWNATNSWLFAGNGASRTLDYFSTLNMRRRGRQEILLNNDVVDNHAAFAAIEAAGTGISTGAAYIFHRTGHHKLERWTSIIHIGATTAGAARNYGLESAHSCSTSSP